MTNAEIVEFPSSGRMTEAEYEYERKQLRALYGDSSTEAAARRDQAMAVLFLRSGWTQEELASKEGLKQPLVTRRLRFGRFLNFMSVGINAENAPINLTERKFRHYWAQTDKAEGNERIRFRATYNLIVEDIHLRRRNRPRIGKDLVEAFGDGKWHSPATMAERLGADVELIESTLQTMSIRGTYGAKSERKKHGKGFHYRIFKTDKKVGTQELAEKLAPIIEGLTVEGKKNAATAAPRAVLILAGNLQRLLDEWTE